MTKIHDTLRSFGITRNYKGYDHAVYCIYLVMDNSLRLKSIKKELYIATAEHFNCDWRNVERNLRTIVSKAWQVNPNLLCQMSGYPIKTQPTASQFIEIVASYIGRCSD